MANFCAGVIFKAYSWMKTLKTLFLNGITTVLFFNYSEGSAGSNLDSR
jgi:hypothetical protein